MGFIDFIRFLFKGEEKLKQEIAESSEDKEENGTGVSQENVDIRNTQTPLDSIKIDKEALALHKVLSEAETINSYLKSVIKEISFYENNIHDKEKRTLAANGISAKMKHVVIHGFELKNLLGIIEEQYYDILINSLKDKPELSNTTDELENDKAKVIDLESELAKLVIYDSKLNSEKNPEYLNAVDEEVKNRNLLNDINNLISKLLAVVIDRNNSLIAKINIEGIQEKATGLV